MARRSLTFLLLTALLLFAVTTVAYAVQGDSTYRTSTVPAGSNPHRDYQVTSKKCSVCHSIHHAGASGNGIGSEALLRSTKAEGCTYCHIYPGVSTKIVYGGDPTLYSGSDLPNGHNNIAAAAFTCTACHQVHAARDQMTANETLQDYMLVKPAAGTDYDPDSDLANNGAPMPGEAKDVAITKWCTRCHAYIPGFLVDTHVLAPADNTHAWGASSYCVSCHNSNTVNNAVPVASAFPHYTDGVRFLTQAASAAGGSVAETKAVDAQYDGVCLRCHRDGVTPGGRGVGLDF